MLNRKKNKTKNNRKKQEEIPSNNLETKLFKGFKNDLIEENEIISQDTKKSRKKPSKKNKEISKKRKKQKRKIKLFFLLIFFIFTISFGIYLGIRANSWKTIATQMLKNENSTVVDTNNKVVAKFGSSRKSKNITLTQIPDNLKNAYVSIEDERFYSHNGVDIKRTGGAILSYVTNFGSSSYGGSTITQQVVKNLTGDSSDSINRKVTEWWKAWQLESCLSKDDILQGYLNIIYVGPNMYGVETASNYYFSKSSSELTLEECAFIAGITNSPNSYNPFSDKDNKEKIKKRSKTVLKKMLDLDYINETDYNTAITNIDNGLKFKKKEISSENPVYSYHTDALLTEIIEDISKKNGISKTFATNYINMGGLTINSTLDSKIQKQLETEFEKSKYIIESKNSGNSSQAAMVIIDHKTGNVTGCIGALGKKTESRPLNRATQSVRQTGSAIKPLAVLVPGIAKKTITASTILDDTERDFSTGYHPTDYNSALGNITLRRAVESSQNVPFVEAMEKITTKKSIKYLEKMGITTLEEEDNNLVLALGGLRKGISPLEMAAAYSTIANDGEYIEPTFYTNITDPLGAIIVKTKQKKRKVFNKDVAYIIKQLLIQPVQGSNGTATYCKISGIDVAAKTGTTDNNYDRWLCGFTPYYTAVTWYGYDQNESIISNNRNMAGLLWANVMARIHTGLKGAEFEKPTTIYSSTICAETGKLANTGCKNTYTEYFLWLTSPEECTKHTGTKAKEVDNNSTKNKTIIDIVQGITEDIDAEETPVNTTKNNTVTNNTTYTNANNTTNTTNNNSSNTNNSNTGNNNSSNTNTNNTNTNTNSNDTNYDSNITNTQNTQNSSPNE